MVLPLCFTLSFKKCKYVCLCWFDGEVIEENRYANSVLHIYTAAIVSVYLKAAILNIMLPLILNFINKILAVRYLY